MAKTLAVPYYYQRDAQWATLCDPPISFSDQGCAVCCVAVITQYIEGGVKNPLTMRDRGVFTRTNIEVNWNNASTQYTYNSATYSGNFTGALAKIKTEIDSDRPVVVRIDGSTSHYVVAYGYNNLCTTSADVKIRDSYSNKTTLSSAMQTWPSYQYIKTIS